MNFVKVTKAKPKRKLYEEIIQDYSSFRTRILVITGYEILRFFSNNLFTT